MNVVHLLDERIATVKRVPYQNRRQAKGDLLHQIIQQPRHLSLVTPSVIVVNHEGI